MATIDTETVIDRPIDEVWATMTDWGRAGEWMSSVDGIRLDGEMAVGARLLFESRGQERSSEIVAIEPGRSVTLRSVQGGVTADYRYHLESVGAERTRATLVADCRTTGLWTLAKPLLGLVIRRTDGGQMEALKTVVERPTG